MSGHPEPTRSGWLKSSRSSQGADCVEVMLFDDDDRALTTDTDEAGRGIASRGRPSRPGGIRSGLSHPIEGEHMLPWSAGLAGRMEEHHVTSELLRGNPLGDPHERPLWVYVPPGYDDEPARRYPVGLRHPGLHRPHRDVAATARRGGSPSPSWPTRSSRAATRRR